MQTKLTLRLESDLIEQAKQYAGKMGKSVSRVVADYFSFLGKKGKSQSFNEKSLSPITRSLLGVFRGKNASKKMYDHYLEDKYR